jgi:hypothetical protein
VRVALENQLGGYRRRFIEIKQISLQKMKDETRAIAAKEICISKFFPNFYLVETWNIKRLRYAKQPESVFS